MVFSEGSEEISRDDIKYNLSFSMEKPELAPPKAQPAELAQPPKTHPDK